MWSSIGVADNTVWVTVRYRANRYGMEPCSNARCGWHVMGEVDRNSIAPVRNGTGYGAVWLGVGRGRLAAVWHGM